MTNGAAGTRDQPRAWKEAAAVAIATGLILFYRFPDRLLDGFLWAEDVSIFIKSAYEHGMRGLLRSYEGYKHLAPRAIAYLAARTTSIHALSHVFPLMSLLATSAATAFIYAQARRLPWHGSPRKWAAGIAFAPVLVPHGGEVYLTPTNLQWIMVPVLVCLLYFAPVLLRRWARVTHLAVAALALTGPFALLLSPIAAGFAVIRRRTWTRPEKWLAAALAFCVLVQLRTLVRWDGLARASRSEPEYLGASVDLLAAALLPQSVIDLAWWVPHVAFGLVVLALAWGARSSSLRLEMAALLGFGALLWLAALTKVGPGVGIHWHGAGSRYTYLPYVLLAWSLILVAGTVASSILRAILLTALGAMLLVSASAFTETNLQPTVIESTGTGYRLKHPPSWTNSVVPGRLPILD